MTFLESQGALARKLNIDFSDIANNDLFSLADLKEWIQLASNEAWDLVMWPFTEDTFTITSDAPGFAAGYYDHPEDFVLGSVHTLLVEGEEWTGPLKFSDYLRYKQQNPTGNEKIWALHKTFIFLNSNAYSVGNEIDLIGKLVAPTLSADADLLPFSPTADNKEYVGNKAIVDIAYANALSSEKLKRESDGEIVHKDALNILAALWRPFAETRANQQSKDRPMFDVPDFFGANRNNTPGNFNL